VTKLLKNKTLWILYFLATPVIAFMSFIVSKNILRKEKERA